LIGGLLAIGRPCEVHVGHRQTSVDMPGFEAGRKPLGQALSRKLQEYSDCDGEDGGEVRC
jgi:hypothetical protein